MLQSTASIGGLPVLRCGLQAAGGRLCTVLADHCRRLTERQSSRRRPPFVKTRQRPRRMGLEDHERRSVKSSLGVGLRACSKLITEQNKKCAVVFNSQSQDFTLVLAAAVSTFLGKTC